MQKATVYTPSSKRRFDETDADADLVAAARQDRQAFAKLYRLHKALDHFRRVRKETSLQHAHGLAERDSSEGCPTDPCP